MTAVLLGLKHSAFRLHTLICCAGLTELAGCTNFNTMCVAGSKVCAFCCALSSSSYLVTRCTAKFVSM